MTDLGLRIYKTQTTNKQETFNVKVIKSHPHIRFLPIHPHSISAAYIRILPVATSADPHIRFLPIAPYSTVLRRLVWFGVLRFSTASCGGLRCPGGPRSELAWYNSIRAHVSKTPQTTISACRLTFFTSLFSVSKICKRTPGNNSTNSLNTCAH